MKMCLSKVYLREKGKDKIVFEEAVNIIDNDGTIEIYTVFGENKKMDGYYIKEIDFVDSNTILSKKKKDVNE
jgi:predicted RNA-binding protein